MVFYFGITIMIVYFDLSFRIYHYGIARTII